MFNQLIKWTIVVGLWRKYKRHVAASLVLLASLLLINYLHLDYLEYAVATGVQGLGFSYLLKWSAFILAIGFYVFHIKRVNRAAKYDSKLHKIMKSNTKADTTEPSPTKAEEQSLSKDPFANIRTKKKLRSEADMLIGKDK